VQQRARQQRQAAQAHNAAVVDKKTRLLNGGQCSGSDPLQRRPPEGGFFIVAVT